MRRGKGGGEFGGGGDLRSGGRRPAAEPGIDAAETCGQAGGEVGDLRRTGEDGPEAGEDQGASFEGTWPTAQEWAEFDLWDAEEERRLAAGGDLEELEDCDDEELDLVSGPLSDVSGQLSQGVSGPELA